MAHVRCGNGSAQLSSWVTSVRQARTFAAKLVSEVVHDDRGVGRLVRVDSDDCRHDYLQGSSVDGDRRGQLLLPIVRAKPSREPPRCETPTRMLFVRKPDHRSGQQALREQPGPGPLNATKPPQRPPEVSGRPFGVAPQELGERRSGMAVAALGGVA